MYYILNQLTLFIGGVGQVQPPQASPTHTPQASQAPLSTPGVVGAEDHNTERQNMNAWRRRNQRHGQKVDAAGFV